jgi:hypothetical protein
MLLLLAELPGRGADDASEVAPKMAFVGKPKVASYLSDRLAQIEAQEFLCPCYTQLKLVLMRRKTSCAFKDACKVERRQSKFRGKLC